MAGGLSLILTLLLLLSYFLRPDKLKHLFYPGRILLNMTVIELLLAARFFLIGVVGDFGDESTHTHSFGLLNYDCLF